MCYCLITRIKGDNINYYDIEVSLSKEKLIKKIDEEIKRINACKFENNERIQIDKQEKEYFKYYEFDTEEETIMAIKNIDEILLK